MEVRPDGSRYIPHLDLVIVQNADDHDLADIVLTKKHYFYLNFWKISCENKFTGRKDLLPPDFTDLSWDNWYLRERSWKEQLDLAWLKARQRGLSEEEAADSGYDFLFYNDVQIAITSGLDVYANNTFEMVKRGVYQLYNSQFWKELKKDNDEHFYTKNTGMEIHCRTAKDNPQILSGLNRLVKAHLEEIGIMPAGLAIEIGKLVKPSIKTGGRRRTGFIVYTGTSGKTESKTGNIELGVVDIEKMIYNPIEYDLISIPNIFDKETEPGSRIATFIPAWKFRIRDEDGNSLKAESIADVLAERASVKPEERETLIQTEPLETGEMFNIVSGGYFGPMIIHHCNSARSRIMTHKSLQDIERGFLHWKDARNPYLGCDWELDMERGDILIAEHPQMAPDDTPIPGLYNHGCDSYDQDRANTSSSKLAHATHKGYNPHLPLGEAGIYNNFVALYLDRPSEEQKGREVAYENSAKLTVYFPGPNMIEYSKILIFDYFEKELNLGGYLAPRPDLAIANMVERSEVSNRFGFPGALVPHGLKVLSDMLKNQDFMYQCPFEQILKAWARFKVNKNYNCDVTIATMLCAVQLDNIIRQMNKPDRDEVKKVIRTFKGFKQINGNIQAVYA